MKLIFLILTLPALAAADLVNLRPSADNTIFSETATPPLFTPLSNGSGQFLFAGATINDAFRRGLIKFDLSSIPANATIDSAFLQLNATRRRTTDSHIHSIHRLTADWGEGSSDAVNQEGAGINAEAGDATWVEQTLGGTDWANPGGDFIATASASVAIGNHTAQENYQFVSAAVVADLQSWVDNPAGNFGWILIGDESATGSATQFAARVPTDPDEGPLLSVNFTVIPEPGVLGLLLSGLAVLALVRRFQTARIPFS